MSVFEILTLVSYLLGGIVAFIVKDKSDELKRQGILLNKTDGGDGGNGRVPWNKGKTNVYSEKTKNRISNTLKGNVPWNKGKTGGQEVWNKGKSGYKTQPCSKERKQKISEKNRKYFEEQPILVCPHCSKIGKQPLIYRWHFDKCKHKGEKNGRI